MAKAAQMDEITWVVEDLWNLPDDGNIYEVIDGELYMTPPPIPDHQNISGNFFYSLSRYIRRHRLGKLFAASCAVILEPGRRGVQPDLFFIRRAHLGIIGEKAVEGVPDLVIEISSPGTARYDRTIKMKVYAEAGVREYWIVDTPKQMVHQFTQPRGSEYTQKKIYHPGDKLRSRLFPELLLKVEELFDVGV
jgi:Uma2 family endonuclease